MYNLDNLHFRNIKHIINFFFLNLFINKALRSPFDEKSLFPKHMLFEGAAKDKDNRQANKKTNANHKHKKF
jgi:hypothetical protein